MRRLLLAILLLLASRTAAAGEVRASYRITGLFQPDRVDDLRRQAGVLRLDDGGTIVEIRLVDVDYGAALVVFAYDGDARAFSGKPPRQVEETINTLLRNASRGCFEIHAPGPRKADQLRQEEIAVAGLDCKGCAFGAYRAIARIDGVERAVVSFREGRITARIHPEKTSRRALVAALRKAEVDVTDPKDAEAKPADRR